MTQALTDDLPAGLTRISDADDLPAGLTRIKPSGTPPGMTPALTKDRLKEELPRGLTRINQIELMGMESRPGEATPEQQAFTRRTMAAAQPRQEMVRDPSLSAKAASLGTFGIVSPETAEDVLRETGRGAIENYRGLARAVPRAGEKLAKLGEFVGRQGNLLFAGATPEEREQAAEEARQFFEGGRAVLDEALPPPKTTTGQVVEELGADVVASAPALGALAPLQIPGRAGTAVTGLLTRAGARPSVAQAVGGAVGAAVGVGEFGAAAEAPEAIAEGRPVDIAKAAVHPFVGTGTLAAKLAQGRPQDVTVGEWVNLGFLSLGAAGGLAQTATVRDSMRQRAEYVTRRARGEDIAEVRNALDAAARRGNADARIAVQEMDSAIKRNIRPTATLRQESPRALQDRQTEAVLQDVRAQPRQGEGQVPAAQRPQGVRVEGRRAQEAAPEAAEAQLTPADFILPQEPAGRQQAAPTARQQLESAGVRNIDQLMRDTGMDEAELLRLVERGTIRPSGRRPAAAQPASTEQPNVSETQVGGRGVRPITRREPPELPSETAQQAEAIALPEPGVGSPQPVEAGAAPSEGATGARTPTPARPTQITPPSSPQADLADQRFREGQTPKDAETGEMFDQPPPASGPTEATTPASSAPGGAFKAGDRITYKGEPGTVTKVPTSGKRIGVTLDDGNKRVVEASGLTRQTPVSATERPAQPSAPQTTPQPRQAQTAAQASPTGFVVPPTDRPLGVAEDGTRLYKTKREAENFNKANGGRFEVIDIPDFGGFAVTGMPEAARPKIEPLTGIDSVPGDLPAPPREPPEQLPGGRQAGSTIIATEVVEELAALSSRIAKGFSSIGVGSYKLGQRVFLKGADLIERQGEAGKVLASGIRRVDQRASELEHETRGAVRDVLRGLKSDDVERVMKAVNLRPSQAGAPPYIRKRADAFRRIMDEAFLEPGQQLGFTRVDLPSGARMPLEGSGKAYPQVPNATGRRFLERVEARGLSDPQVYRFAEQMVSRGQANSAEDALAKIKRYHDAQRRGVVSILERTRVELPENMVDWNPNRVLPHVLHRASLAIESARQWGGPKLPKVDALIAKIGADTKDLGLATKIDRFLKHELGVAGEVVTWDARAAGAVSNYETIVRLGGSIPSAIRNMGQRVGTTVDYPLPVVMRALKDYPPLINQFIPSARRLADSLERSGAIRSQSELATIETNVPGEKLTRVALKPFLSVEHGNQITAALIANYGVQRDIDRLIRIEGKEGKTHKIIEAVLSPLRESPSVVRRRVARSGLTNDQLADMLASGNRLTPQQIREVMNRIVSDTQFPMTLATRPIWYGTAPWLRLLWKFKTFPTRVTGLMWNTVAKEAFKGNPRPLIRAVAYLVLAGELWNVVRDYLVADERSLTMSMINRPDRRNAKDIAIRLGADLVDGGFVGMFADVVFGVGNVAAGPVGGTVKNVFEAVLDIKRRPTQTLTALRRLASKEVSVARQTALVSRLDRAFFNENNRAIESRIWRRRAYEFREKKQGERDIIDKAIEGFRSFPRNDRSLSYEYAAKQIDVGDVEDAADYIARLLRDAKTRQERKDLLKAIRSSRDARSPLGPVAERDRRAFLEPFDPETRRAAVALDREWRQDYDKAIRQAMALARDND